MKPCTYTRCGVKHSVLILRHTFLLLNNRSFTSRADALNELPQKLSLTKEMHTHTRHTYLSHIPQPSRNRRQATVNTFSPLPSPPHRLSTNNPLPRSSLLRISYLHCTFLVISEPFLFNLNDHDDDNSLQRTCTRWA